ncbi:Rne/Rng family ribonuclease [bacterium]|nr:MAG: Rne/Rng family ribonuclease [bacterium]
MPSQMYINVRNEEESRIAILENGLLEELSVETASDDTIEGNIYKGKIDRVVPGLEAAFVDYGREKNGFLAFSEINSEYFQGGDRKPENLLRGQEVMVQVKKGEIGDKGAALTTYVSIPGRYLVLMPQISKRGVSKQILDAKIRDSLKKTIDEAGMPEDMGYIVRTAAGDQNKEEIQRDVSFMLRVWKKISEIYESTRPPAILYRESDLVIRTIRDYFTPEISEILIDHPKVYEKVSAFFKTVMPWNAGRVRLYEGKAPLFSKHNLELQIASIYEDKVKLPSGGSIVIQRTEALVSVDVNSGGGPGVSDIEKTAFITNMEAAVETARQLRLRDLGGLIVIDFIDMRSSANRTKLKKEFLKAVKRDKARIDVGMISKFGILELSRQRLKSVTGLKLANPCPLCGGSGKLRSTEAFALSVLRVIHQVLAKAKDARAVSIGVPLDTAAFLVNRKRNDIIDLEMRFSTPINVFAEPDLLPNQYYCEFALEDRVRTESNLPQGYDARRLHAEGTSGKAEYQAKRTIETVCDEAASYLGIQEEIPPAKAEQPAAKNGGRGKRGRGRQGKPQAEPVTLAPPQSEANQPEVQPAAVLAEEVPAAEPEKAENGEGPRKRRRRRRRSRKSGAERQAALEGLNNLPQAEVAPPPAQSPAESAPAESAPAETPSGEKKSSSSRRRRRRGRRSGQEANASLQQNQSAPPAAVELAPPPPPPPVEAPPAVSAEAAPKAKKPRPARKPKKPAAGEAAAQEPPTPAKAEAGGETPKKTPSPRRRSPRKKPENTPES